MASLGPCLQEWVNCGASPWVLQVLETGYRLQWATCRPPLSREPKVFPRPATLDKVQVLDEEVQSLLRKGAIAPVLDCSSPGYYSRLFTVPKRTGGYRPVLDLSPLNRFLRKCPFRMDTPAVVRSALRPGDWTASLDLSDAYFHIPIHVTDRKWLRFHWKGQNYEFTVLPFGLSQSPWVFTRVVKVIVGWLRLRNVRFHAYLDDWLVIASQRELCGTHLQLAQSKAQALGFRINLAKSDLIPSQKFHFLGMELDTVAWTVVPAAKRVENLLLTVAALEQKQTASAKEVASALGCMEAMHSLVPLARVYKRPFQREFLARFNQATEPWSKIISIQPWFKDHVGQWRQPTWLYSTVPLQRPVPAAVIHVDASLTGWGAHTLQEVASGGWSVCQRSWHINALELTAVGLALKRFSQILPKGHIQVVSDNMTVVSLINHQGGTHSPSLSRTVEETLLWASQNQWDLTAVHLKGSRNVLADILSRRQSIVPTEWTLALPTLEPIWRAWGVPEIDLFATRLNNRLPKYVSPVPDSRAYDVDAMSMEWDRLHAYAFPPISLLPAVLKKVEQSEGRLVLVAPWWPTAQWFSTLRALAHNQPMSLRLRHGDLYQPQSLVPHRGLEALNLHAWLLCGRNCNTQGCQKQL